MLYKIPSREELADLIGQSLYDVWEKLCTEIDKKYEMDRLWDNGGKAWTYEYKYRRGGKTLCGLYAKENYIGILIIFGKKERDIFETFREDFSEAIQKEYDEAKTYHDGKWVMFKLAETSNIDEFIKLLGIKRKPNKK